MANQSKEIHMFEVIFENVINDVLNDSYTQNILYKIDKQPVQLFSQFDSEEPASNETISKGIEDEQNRVVPQKNFKDFRQLFLEEEFVDLVDLIMENTFFNVI